MKKKILSLIILLFMTSCYTTYKVITERYNFNEKINFTIDKVVEDKQVYDGNGYWKPKSGYKFITLFITLNNETNEKQPLNFNDFYLINLNNKEKYKVEMVMLTGPINIKGKIESTIEKNDTKKRRVIFTFPENEKAKFVLANNNIIEIKYQN